MRYNMNYDFNREGDREIEFQDFRKELETLFVAIGKVVGLCFFSLLRQSRHWKLAGCQCDVLSCPGYSERSIRSCCIA